MIRNLAVSSRRIALATAFGAGSLACPAFAATDPCSVTTSPSGGTVYTTDGVGSEAADGNHELWHDGGGTMKMTVYGQHAAFKAEWNNAGDFLARVGYGWGNGGLYSSYGNVVTDFNFTKSGSGGGYSYIGIYGWSKNPLVEYYVCENGFWTTPPNASALGGATAKGSFDIDGGTYDLYTYQRVNKPSISGTATFNQFWSVRRTPRTCGTITLSEHWKKWASVGMTLGNMYEAKLLVEAGGGQGTFDMRYGTFTLNATSVADKPSYDAAPRIVRSATSVSWDNGEAGTVSLVSLDGTVLRSEHQTGMPAAQLRTSDVPRGMYVLRFQGENTAPKSTKLLVD
jgi:hypothetical protein